MSSESLLSGLIGAIIAVILSIIYQEIKIKREIKYSLAKERLGKIYGPLLLILEANTTSSEDNKFLYTKKEEEKIDKILFNNYHLIDRKRRKILSYLYSHKKFSKEANNDKIVNAIRKGYIENKKLLKIKDD